ncbi:MAG: hypothetical protein ACRDRJ_25980 [Streptosporangiaceae bacterium]
MKDIDLTVTVDQPMPQAQNRILDRVDQRLRGVGLTQRVTPGGLEYRPKFIGLVFVWLVRRLQHEGVTFTFDARGRATEVRAAGRLRNRAYAELTEALGGN